jgi:hypothetical protein
LDGEPSRFVVNRLDIQDETNNGLLKKFYASQMNEQKLLNNCSLLK